MGQILSVDNLNVYYGAIHAIKGVSFEVNEGEIVTLIGANGAGKSTTLQTVSGVAALAHGQHKVLRRGHQPPAVIQDRRAAVLRRSRRDGASSCR